MNTAEITGFRTELEKLSAATAAINEAAKRVAKAAASARKRRIKQNILKTRAPGSESYKINKLTRRWYV